MCEQHYIYTLHIYAPIVYTLYIYYRTFSQYIYKIKIINNYSVTHINTMSVSSYNMTRRDIIIN